MPPIAGRRCLTQHNSLILLMVRSDAASFDCTWCYAWAVSGFEKCCSPVTLASSSGIVSIECAVDGMAAFTMLLKFAQNQSSPSFFSCSQVGRAHPGDCTSSSISCCSNCSNSQITMSCEANITVWHCMSCSTRQER